MPVYLNKDAMQFRGEDGQFHGINMVTDENVAVEVGKWLNENVSGGDTIAVDKSLSVDGAAADAKAVGELKSAFNTILVPLNYSGRRLPGYVNSSNGLGKSNSTTTRTETMDGYGKIVAIDLPNNDYEYRLAIYGENGSQATGTDYIRSTEFQQGFTFIPADAIKFALTMRRVDQSSLTDNDKEVMYSALKLYSNTDSTLSFPNKAADAKAVRDNIHELYNAVFPDSYSETMDDFYYAVGSISLKNGDSTTSTTRLRLRETMIIPDNILSICVNPGYKFVIYIYDDWKGNYLGNYYNGSVVKQSTLPTDAWCTDKMDIPSELKGLYMRLLVGKTDDSTMVRSDAENLIFVYDAYNKSFKHELSYGRKNAQASARQMATVKWTPIQSMPLLNSAGYIEAGTECIGLPYSSTTSLCKYIGQHLSFYTFLTALQNPRSVLYTRRATIRPLGKTYYGITCFTLTSFASGSKLGYFDNEIARMYNGDNVQISPYEIEPGDALLLMFTREEEHSYMHAILIYDVNRDKYGRITSVQLAESMSPCAIIHPPISFKTFLNKYVYGGHKYKIYRKTNRVDYGMYEPVSGVIGHTDEQTDIESYPDIMPEYGDKACIEEGTDVVINVINPRSYSKIEVFKDDALQQTITTIEDFTMYNIAYGTYKFIISSDDEQSESYLIVANINATYNSETGIVSFSSTNAKPVFIASYHKRTGVQNIVKYLTEEEIEAGEASTENLVGELYTGVEIGFLTEYGVAMWLSDRSLLPQEWEPFVAP